MAKIARGAAVVAVVAWLVGWAAQLAFGDRRVIRWSPLVGSDEDKTGLGWVTSIGLDYLVEGEGKRPLLISLDRMTEFEPSPGDREESISSLVVSLPVNRLRGRSIFVGAGLAFAKGLDVGGGQFTVGELRVTATSPLKKGRLVWQAHVTPISSLGVLMDFSLGVGF